MMDISTALPLGLPSGATLASGAISEEGSGDFLGKLAALLGDGDVATHGEPGDARAGLAGLGEGQPPDAGAVPWPIVALIAALRPASPAPDPGGAETGVDGVVGEAPTASDAGVDVVAPPVAADDGVAPVPVVPDAGVTGAIDVMPAAPSGELADAESADLAEVRASAPATVGTVTVTDAEPDPDVVVDPVVDVDVDVDGAHAPETRENAGRAAQGPVDAEQSPDRSVEGEGEVVLAASRGRRAHGQPGAATDAPAGVRADGAMQTGGPTMAEAVDGAVPVATSTAPHLAEQPPVVSSAVQRVLDALELLENAPPPRQLTLELGDVRLRVAMDDGQVRLTLLGDERQQGRALLEETRMELRERGFDLGNGDRGERRGHTGPDDDDRGRPTPPPHPMARAAGGLRL